MTLPDRWDEQHTAINFYSLCCGVPEIQYLVETSVSDEDDYEPASEQDVETLVQQALEKNGVKRYATEGFGPDENINDLSLPAACCLVLEESNLFKKAALTLYYSQMWFDKS